VRVAERTDDGNGLRSEGRVLEAEMLQVHPHSVARTCDGPS
jgi:hypothetical protein